MSLLAFASMIFRNNVTYRCPTLCMNRLNNPKKLLSSIGSKPIHDVNTNIVKDVILFKYENPKFFKYINIFAVVQYMFWSYLGTFAFNTLKDTPVDESKITDQTPWFRRINLGENKYKNAIGAIAIIVGTGSLGIVWMYTLKTVRFLILNKGGRHLTFVTYSPLGKNRIMKVPVECVNCKESRTTAKVQLPIKVKNTWLHYMLDMRGEFKNPTLFDCTAGLTRKW